MAFKLWSTLKHSSKAIDDVYDKKLPKLTLALHHGSMIAYFKTRINQFDTIELQDIQELCWKILKYVPGKRCVIEYRIIDSKGNEASFIGKAYRKHRGRITFNKMLNLQGAASALYSPLNMPRPLWYSDELNMVFMTKISGTPVTSYLKTEASSIDRVIEKIAVNLACLHHLPINSDWLKSGKALVEKYCRPEPERLLEALPHLRTCLQETINTLLSNEMPETPKSWVHGDLGLSQILLDSEQAYFIDFDSSFVGPPSLDLCVLIASIEHHLGKAAKAVIHQLLANYTQLAPPQHLSGFCYFKALVYLRKAFIAFRNQSQPGWRDLVHLNMERAHRFASRLSRQTLFSVKNPSYLNH